MVNFGHPANRGILRFLKEMQDESDLPKHPPSISPDDVEEPYIRLGTHPDVVTRLWDELTTHLPVSCAWCVYGKPVLVRPDTGVIFGMGSGTPTYALRLPEWERSEAVRLGAKTVWTYNDAWLKELGPEHNTTLNLATWGQDWIFGKRQADEPYWCLAAYHHAAPTELGPMR